MWLSYHIYNTNYERFLTELKRIQDQFMKDSDRLFFTVYSDFRGLHYRLRLSLDTSVEVIENELNAVFSQKNIEKRIYDPEVIKYGCNVKNYELFSTNVCSYIILKEIFKKSTEERLDIAISIIIQIMKELGCLDTFQIESSILYWKKSWKFYKSVINKDIFSLIENKSIDYYSLLSPVRTLKKLPMNQKRKLCFNYIHLTINRLNFSIKDECFLYYKIREIKKRGIEF